MFASYVILHIHLYKVTHMHGIFFPQKTIASNLNIANVFHSYVHTNRME